MNGSLGFQGIDFPIYEPKLEGEVIVPFACVHRKCTQVDHAGIRLGTAVHS